MHAYYFHAYGKFIFAHSGLRNYFSNAKCMDKRHLQANNKVSRQAEQIGFAETLRQLVA